MPRRKIIIDVPEENQWGAIEAIQHFLGGCYVYETGDVFQYNKKFSPLMDLIQNEFLIYIYQKTIQIRLKDPE